MSGWVSYWHHRVGHPSSFIPALLFCAGKPAHASADTDTGNLPWLPLPHSPRAPQRVLFLDAAAAFVFWGMISASSFIHLCHELHHGALRNLHHLPLPLSQMSPHLSLLNQEQNQAGTVYYRQYAHAVQDQRTCQDNRPTTLPKASGSLNSANGSSISEFNSEIQKKVFKNCNAQLTIQHFQKVSWIIKV